MKKYDKNTWMGGDVDPKELARENEKAPDKDNPKKTRGMKSGARANKKAPERDKGFFKHTTKGKC